jgi:hypothetical protein
MRKPASVRLNGQMDRLKADCVLRLELSEGVNERVKSTPTCIVVSFSLTPKWHFCIVLLNKNQTLTILSSYHLIISSGT